VQRESSDQAVRAERCPWNVLERQSLRVLVFRGRGRGGAWWSRRPAPEGKNAPRDRIDVEVVDAKGQRLPTDDGVDFTVRGPGIWRGGCNNGKINSTDNLYLNTECGINRVSVRSTLWAGTITVTASRSGLKSAQIEIVAKPAKIVDGLVIFMPQHLLRGPAEN